MQLSGFDWTKVGEDLRDMGGWENTRPGSAPDPDHGAAPIADRPRDWDWRPRVPEWLRGIPDFEPAAGASASGAPATDVATAEVDKQPAGPPSWMYGEGGPEAFLAPVLGPNDVY